MFRFWSQVSEHSPETRLQIAAQVLKQQKERQKGHNVDPDPARPPKREYKLFSADGKPRNINETKIPFVLTEDDQKNCLVLDIAVYRYGIMTLQSNFCVVILVDECCLWCGAKCYGRSSPVC
jgi:hypothetical protein